MPKQPDISFMLQEPQVDYHNHDEFDAACYATLLLAQIVLESRKAVPHDEEDHETDEDDFEQFLFGQHWDTEPEIWDDHEPWDVIEGYFDEEGYFHPRKLRDL